MPNPITWSGVIFILGPALLATLSTLAGVWLTHHFQLKTKKTELDAQAKLKARELLFNSYQQKLDRKREALSKASSGMGQFIAQVKLAKDEEEKREILTLLNTLTSDVTDLITSYVDELEEELNREGLTHKRKKQMDFIRANAKKHLQMKTTEELEAALFNVWKVSDAVAFLEQELLEKKCEDLFGEYLPKSQSLAPTMSL